MLGRLFGVTKFVIHLYNEFGCQNLHLVLIRYPLWNMIHPDYYRVLICKLLLALNSKCIQTFAF